MNITNIKRSWLIDPTAHSHIFCVLWCRIPLSNIDEDQINDEADPVFCWRDGLLEINMTFEITRWWQLKDLLFPPLPDKMIQIWHYFLKFDTKPPAVRGGRLAIVLHSGKRSHSHCWNIPMFNRKYIDSIRVHFPASYVGLPESICIVCIVIICYDDDHHDGHY